MFDINLKEIWRPETFSDIVLLPRIKEKFPDGKIVDNYLFYGSHGLGKTSFAKILAKQYDWKYWNIADQTGINTLRHEIIPFLSTVGSKTVFDDSISSTMKVVILDEIDSASAEFFDAFKATIEQFPHHRFIATTNHINRIPVASVSRFQFINWNPLDLEEETLVKNGYAKRLKQIILKSGKQITAEALKQLIIQSYPDMRQMVSNVAVLLQLDQSTIEIEHIKSKTDDSLNLIFDLLTNPPDSEKNWIELYKFKDKYKEVMHSIANGFPEWLKNNHFEIWKKGLGAILVAIAEWQSKMPQMIDPFLALLACSHQIQSIIKEIKK